MSQATLEDGYIDLFRDGALGTARKLVELAYNEPGVEGGFDAPSATCLSHGRGGAYASDLHLEVSEPFELDWDLDGYVLSEVISDAPRNRGKEAIPERTRAPFIDPLPDHVFTGTFGECTKRVVEAVSLLKSAGSECSPLIEWFGSAWGLDTADCDRLKALIPVTKSQGAAAWAGYKRGLHPTVFGYPATQAMLRVVHHGKHRTAWGEDMLVDWSKVSTLCRVIVAQVCADDILKVPRRMDYNLMSEEFPRAPKHVRVAITRVPLPAHSPLLKSARLKLDLMERARGDRATVGVSYTGDHVNFLYQEPKVTDPIPFVRKLVGISGFDRLPPLGQPAKPGTGTLREPKLKRPGRGNRAGVQGWRNAVMRMVFQNNNTNLMGTVRQTRELVEDLELEGVTDELFAAAQRKLHDTLGVGWVRKLVMWGNLVKPGLGKSWVGHIYRDAGDVQGDLMIGNLSVLEEVLTSRPVLVAEVLQAVSAGLAACMAQVGWTVSRSDVRRFANSRDFFALVEGVLRRRKVYWASRYATESKAAAMRYKRALDNAEESGEPPSQEWRIKAIQYQSRATCMKHLVLEVDYDGQISGVGQSVAKALCQQAANLVSKRLPGKVYRMSKLKHPTIEESDERPERDSVYSIARAHIATWSTELAKEDGAKHYEVRAPVMLPSSVQNGGLDRWISTFDFGEAVCTFADAYDLATHSCSELANDLRLFLEDVLVGDEPTHEDLPDSDLSSLSSDPHPLLDWTPLPKRGRKLGLLQTANLPVATLHDQHQPQPPAEPPVVSPDPAPKPVVRKRRGMGLGLGLVPAPAAHEEVKQEGAGNIGAAVAVAPKAVAPRGFGLGGGTGAMKFEKVDDRVNVRNELRDDWRGVPPKWHSMVIRRLGESATLEDYERVRDEVRKEYAKSLVTTDANSEAALAAALGSTILNTET